MNEETEVDNLLKNNSTVSRTMNHEYDMIKNMCIVQLKM